MNNNYRQIPEATPRIAAKAELSVKGGQLAWSDELAAGDFK